MLIFLGFFLTGIGTSVYYSLGTSYIDDQVTGSQSSFYLSECFLRVPYSHRPKPRESGP